MGFNFKMPSMPKIPSIGGINVNNYKEKVQGIINQKDEIIAQIKNAGSAEGFQSEIMAQKDSVMSQLESALNSGETNTADIINQYLGEFGQGGQ